MALRYWKTSSTKRILTTESEWSKKRRSCWDRHNRFPKVRITKEMRTTIPNRSPHVAKQKWEHFLRWFLSHEGGPGWLTMIDHATWSWFPFNLNCVIFGILGVHLWFSHLSCASAPGGQAALLLRGVRAWQGALGASWEGRGKRVKFPQFSVDSSFL